MKLIREAAKRLFFAVLICSIVPFVAVIGLLLGVDRTTQILDAIVENS